MKAEERKHLATNSLAENLTHLLDRAKQGPSRRALVIGGVVVLAVALFFTWRYFSSSSEEKSSHRWVGDLTLLDPDQLKGTIDRLQEEKASPRPGEAIDEWLSAARLDDFIKAKDNEGTSQARIARFQLARQRLKAGMEGLGAGATRAGARDSLMRAADEYEKLATEAADSPLLLQEALLNAGKAREALGEYDAARKHYEALAKKEHEKSVAGKEAAALLTSLNDPAMKPFYDKLAAELK